MKQGWVIGRTMGLALLLMGAAALALHGDVASATYKENKWCMACHKARNADIVTGWQKTGHANTFWKVGQEKAGEQIVADFGASAPFTKDKVAYVMGAGERRQAFLDASLKVLPGEWQVEQKTWKTIPADDATTECLGCHTTAFDAAAKTWVEAGVSCQMCHGPGSEHMTASDKKATIVRPETLEPHARAAICGQCHSTGRDPSGKYAFPVAFRPSQDLAAKFNITKPAGHAPMQQYSELMQSPGHWANNVVCDTCHDPHGASAQPYQLKKPVNDLCLGCHAGKITGPQHAAENLAKQTCAKCHMPDGAHFFKKPQ